MAPEQRDSRAPLTPAADIYSLGCVFFEMLAGKRYAQSAFGTRVSEFRQDVPAWLDDVIATMLAENPADRYVNALSILQVLKQGGSRVQGVKRTREENPEKPEVEITGFIPVSKGELAQVVTVEARTRVSGPIFSLHTVTTGNNVTIQGLLYAQEAIETGETCRIEADIISQESLILGSSSRVAGQIVIPGSGPVRIGHSCEIKGGIITRADVVIADRCKITFVQTSGNVTIGNGCRIERVIGRDIQIGANCELLSVHAHRDLILQHAVTLDHCRVNNRLKLEGGIISIQQMDTLLCREFYADPKFEIRFRRMTATSDHVFTWDGKNLAPYNLLNTVNHNQRICITSLIDHNAVRTTGRVIANLRQR